MSSQTTPSAEFGPNQWLVEEMYQQYLRDPASVDEAWHDFFADYRPVDLGDGQGDRAGTVRIAAQDRAAVTPLRERPPAAAQAPPPQSVAPAPPQPPAPAAPPLAPPAPPPPAAPPPPPAKPPAPQPAAAPTVKPLRGASARVVANMEQSLAVPTATSVRAVPAKLLSDNRIVINNALARGTGGKVSFTHLIGWAVVRALADRPEMNSAFTEVDGKPALAVPDHVNLGLAIDLAKADGSRSLVVPSIKRAETMDFRQFWNAYEDIIRRARAGKLTVEDFAGTTITLTNPGTIGTVHSVPRLMPGQGTIVGVGAMEYPAEFSGLSPSQLADLAISRTITLTSTYDHRIIQGAQSGEFLRRIHQLLIGENGFFDGVFRALRIPYEPVRWTHDITTSREGQVDKQARVIELIHAYRVRGHLMADTDPLEFKQRSHPDLDILEHGLTLWDLDREFPVNGFAGEKVMALRDILGVVRDAYCRTVGVEYMHIQDPDQRQWIQQRVETRHAKSSAEEQKHLLGRLNVAEAFETFLQTKYVGQKRFSLEGAESVIPLLDAIISTAARAQLDEVVIGMPHRGRLNVLANIVGKSYEQIFREFEGNLDPGTTQGSGDVKYHLGATGTFETADGAAKIDVSVASNPSHLEAVDPVAEGIARAKQDILDKGEAGYTVLPLLLHGDAAFAGQGVVAETLNLSQLRGYRTGGTVHVVVNNQVGFTTGPTSARSSVYSTDAARMIQAPIFHVNGDDPEAVVRVGRLAFEFRQAFRKDVVIDLICYRRRGHSEVDEPSFTQPLMYEIIDRKRSVRKVYTEALIGRGDITLEEAEAALRDYRAQLEKVFLATRQATGRSAAPEQPLPAKTALPQPETAVDLEVLKRIAESQVSWPDGFAVHKRLKPQLERRAGMVTNGIDWAMAETLAFGSLLLQGHPVRLAGQDSRRGTFGQRHAVIVDRESGEEYTPLAHLDAHQARFYAYDSLLSEFAAMGFEYGYTVGNPLPLVLWEAQFGDFASGAQSIVDEFVSAGEAKWGQCSGLVLLLPHGYEGQGPDHSSARVERYLQMCAEDNMTVAMPTSPANYFHLLRQQALSQLRRPLVVFTPKSILRLRAATSPAREFVTGGFRPVLADPGVDRGPLDPAAVERVVLSSGKIYYDLLAARAKRDIRDVALVRVERLYPLPADEVAEILAGYPRAREHLWVQEEPANQGPWPFVALNLPAHLPDVQLRRISRRPSASPATGSSAVHEAEQAALVDAALGR